MINIVILKGKIQTIEEKTAKGSGKVYLEITLRQDHKDKKTEEWVNTYFPFCKIFNPDLIKKVLSDYPDIENTKPKPTITIIGLLSVSNAKDKDGKKVKYAPTIIINKIMVDENEELLKQIYNIN